MVCRLLLGMGSMILPYKLQGSLLLKLQSFSEVLSILVTCIAMLMYTHKRFVRYMTTYPAYLLCWDFYFLNASQTTVVAVEYHYIIIYLILVIRRVPNHSPMNRMFWPI